MRYIKNILFVPFVFLLFAYTFIGNTPLRKIKYSSKSSVNVPEPSDVVFDKETHHLFIPSDNGILYECDSLGRVIRKAETLGWDFEGVEIKGNSIYVSDESSRKIYKYNKKDLTVEAVYSVPYQGGRNEGFESITYNESKSCFVLISEKNPVSIIELNDNFQIINQQIFKASRDISSARWFNGQMYLLSDENRCILQCDPYTYKVNHVFQIDVINPEGISFDNSGNVLIAADDIQYLYYFNSFSTKL
ncbi:MAG: SdiA-regulated domain-containing protein [Bacteroidota bacterium]